MRVIVSANFSYNRRKVGDVDTKMAYVVGLQRLGHDVYVITDVDPKQCFDDDYRRVVFQAWEGRQYFESLMRACGVWPRCCLIYDRGQATHGMSLGEAAEVAKTAELLLNIGGKLRTPEILDNVGCRAYVDIDPAKTQVYYSEYGVKSGLEHHHFFFTVGLNLGSFSCEIPTCGFVWRPIVPPVVLAMWPSHIDPRSPRFTTISSWAGKHTFNFKGQFSGDKAEQWRAFIDLPRRTNQELEIALGIESDGYDKDIRLFKEHGWMLADPKAWRTLDDYQRYIAGSRAEFSVANHRVVQFNTGWFSDRSARYLASGKPVLVQSTGIEHHVPTGKGLLTFTTMQEAVAGIEAINNDYLAHCRAAREIAEEYFDSDKVLGKMLGQMGFGKATVSRVAAVAS